MIENINSGLIANFLFAIIIIVIGWMIYFLTERRKMLNFFNITETKRLVIYLSNLRIIRGGSIGIDNQPRAYAGPTVVYGEQVTASKYKERFNYLVPALSESPSLLSKILFADIKVTSLPSPLSENEIEANSSIISFGSPGYNKVSEFIENHHDSIMRFVNDNSEIQVTNLPNLTDGEIGLIQRIAVQQDGVNRSLFYVAGLAEHGTVGAANYLLNNWKLLRKKYRDDESFIISVRFPINNIANYTIDFERRIE